MCQWCHGPLDNLLTRFSGAVVVEYQEKQYHAVCFLKLEEMARRLAARNQGVYL